MVSELERPAAAARTQVPGRSPVVLVADDDPEVLGTLDIILSKSGFEVVLATDGAEALDRFRAHAVDMVITDLAMPKLNGLQLARLCKRQKPGTPVVMITAWGVLVSEDEQQAAGIDLVLAKPVRMAEIVASVRGLWESRSGGESEPGPDLE